MKYIEEIDEVPFPKSMLYHTILNEFVDSGFKAACIPETKQLGVYAESMRAIIRNHDYPVRVRVYKGIVYLERRDDESV